MVSPKAGPRLRTVLLLGASGTIGRATATALVRAGHEVVCLVRPQSGPGGRMALEEARRMLAPATVRCAHAADAASLQREGFAGEQFDAVVSCLASRTGAPAEAWAVDHAAHVHALRLAQAAGVSRFVYLSALCVQKPRLAFQHAKLAFEAQLRSSGMEHCIVRPTAFFKSLSGQVQRVREGKPFVVFGDGRLTACKPIADEDLADFLVRCVDDPACRNRTLPVGGPGPAITPREQGEQLFRLLGRTARFRQVPLGVMDAVVGALSLGARLVPALQAKAEFARIGRYYASESMLVWDEAAQRYDEAATPSHGSRTLWAHYADMLQGRASADLGEHALF